MMRPHPHGFGLAAAIAVSVAGVALLPMPERSARAQKLIGRFRVIPSTGMISFERNGKTFPLPNFSFVKKKDGSTWLVPAKVGKGARRNRELRLETAGEDIYIPFKHLGLSEKELATIEKKLAKALSSRIMAHSGLGSLFAGALAGDRKTGPDEGEPARKARSAKAPNGSRERWQLIHGDLPGGFISSRDERSLAMRAHTKAVEKLKDVIEDLGLVLQKPAVVSFPSSTMLGGFITYEHEVFDLAAPPSQERPIRFASVQHVSGPLLELSWQEESQLATGPESIKQVVNVEAYPNDLQSSFSKLLVIRFLRDRYAPFLPDTNGIPYNPDASIPGVVIAPDEDKRSAMEAHDLALGTIDGVTFQVASAGNPAYTGKDRLLVTLPPRQEDGTVIYDHVLHSAYVPPSDSSTGSSVARKSLASQRSSASPIVKKSSGIEERKIDFRSRYDAVSGNLIDITEMGVRTFTFPDQVVGVPSLRTRYIEALGKSGKTQSGTEGVDIEAVPFFDEVNSIPGVAFMPHDRTSGDDNELDWARKQVAEVLTKTEPNAPKRKSWVVSSKVTSSNEHETTYAHEAHIEGNRRRFFYTRHPKRPMAWTLTELAEVDDESAVLSSKTFAAEEIIDPLVAKLFSTQGWFFDYDKATSSQGHVLGKIFFRTREEGVAVEAAHRKAMDKLLRGHPEPVLLVTRPLSSTPPSAKIDEPASYEHILIKQGSRKPRIFVTQNNRQNKQ